MTEETRLLANALLWSAVVPSALTALAVALCSKGPKSLRASGWPLALAVALGHVAFQLGTGWKPAWPPREALHWLPFAALAAVLVGLLPRSGKPAVGRLRVLAQLSLFAGLAWLLVRPLALRTWSSGQTALVLTLLTVLAALCRLGLEKAGSRSPSPFAVVPVLVSATAASGVAVLSHSARSGQLFGSLAAPFGVLVLFTLFRFGLRTDRGAATVATALSLGLLVNLQVYVQVPLHVVGLLVLSLMSSHLVRVPLLLVLGKKKQWWVAVLAASLPAVLALALVWAGAEPADDYYY